MEHFGLITGATSGIGWELVHLLSDQNIKLIVTGRDGAKLKQLEKKFGCIPIKADLTLKEGRKKVIDMILDKKPTLIINNAGMALYGDFLDHSLSDQMEVIRVNGDALVEITYVGGKTLQYAEKEGVILNISSVAGEFPCSGMATYSAAKSFVTNFSKAIDYELKPNGICVLVTILGQVKTNFAKRAAKKRHFRRQEPALSAKKAAELILRQIKKQKGVMVIPWTYKFIIPFASWLPSRWVCTKIYRSIKNRIA